jgi:hypothetical protein
VLRKGTSKGEQEKRKEEKGRGRNTTSQEQRTNLRAGHVSSTSEALGDSKVTDLDDTSACEEDVLRLQIPVHNVLFVDVFHSKTHLEMFGEHTASRGNMIDTGEWGGRS